MTDLGTIGGSGSSSEAHGINNRGQVVGYGSTASGNSHAVLWQGGAMTDLGTLGGTFAVATSINDRGMVVGESKTATGLDHAFLRRDGAMTDLGTLGGSYAHASHINNRGQVVGESRVGSGSVYAHAFLWQDGTMTDLGTLGGSSSPHWASTTGARSSVTAIWPVATFMRCCGGTDA